MSEEINELKAELRKLQSRLDELDQAEQHPVGRRNMLRSLGLGAAGAAVGGLALSQPAAAADPNDLVLNTANGTTVPTGIFTEAGYTANPQIGAFHVTNDQTKTDPTAALSCISAIATGVDGGAQRIALFGSGLAVGAKLDGPTPLKLTDSTNSTVPSTSAYPGEFQVDDGDLWFCTDSDILGGDPKWRRITGQNDAGMFTAVNPYRVYDSRQAINAANDGPLAAGANRVVDCSDALDVASGATVTADATPVDSSAIAYNITIVDPTLGGFLSVAPQDATVAAASTINWGFGTVGAIANSSVVKLAGDRQIKVFCGGIGATDFIIDVVGVYG